MKTEDEFWAELNRECDARGLYPEVWQRRSKQWEGTLFFADEARRGFPAPEYGSVIGTSCMAVIRGLIRAFESGNGNE